MTLLRQCLLDTYLVRLRVIAQFWDIELTATRQREAALELALAMADPQTIALVREALSDEEGRALQALVGSGGQMPKRVFTRKWGDIRTMGPGRMERDQPWKQPISPAEGLWYKGFVFFSFEQGAEGAYEAIFVPPEIRAHLPGSDAKKPVIAVDPGPEPGAVFSTGDFLLDDACTLLSYVQNQEPRLRSGQPWPGGHGHALLKRLRIADGAYLGFLAHLAHAIGWLVADDSGYLRLHPDSVMNWLNDTGPGQQCRLVAGWREDPTLNELFQVPSLQPEDTGAWHNDPRLARRAILQHIAACTPKIWYRISDFAAAVKRVDPDFQRPAGDYETWYIRDRDNGDYLSGFESWDAVEGRLIRYLISRPMTWLGLVDLGYDSSVEVDRSSHSATAFRLTERGAAILSLTEPPPSPPDRASRLRSGFRVSVPAERRYERFQIARVTEWVHSGDRYTYRLTPGALKRARQKGISVARVLEFLDQVTAAPIPPLLESALTRWDERGTEVRLERSVLLRLANEQLMDQARASRRVARLIQEQLGPTTALVREVDWPQLVAELEAMGLLPEVTGLSDDSETRQLTATRSRLP